MTVKRGRGRPPEGERVEVRIPADLLKVIDKIAARRNTTRPALLRSIIAEWAEEVS